MSEMKYASSNMKSLILIIFLLAPSILQVTNSTILFAPFYEITLSEFGVFFHIGFSLMVVLFSAIKLFLPRKLDQYYAGYISMNQFHIFLVISEIPMFLYTPFFVWTYAIVTGVIEPFFSLPIPIIPLVILLYLRMNPREVSQYSWIDSQLEK